MLGVPFSSRVRCLLIPFRIAALENIMTTATLSPDELKCLLKSAIAEVLEERRDWMREIVEDALEEIALQRAIDEGLESPKVSREEVFAYLENAQ